MYLKESQRTLLFANGLTRYHMILPKIRDEHIRAGAGTHFDPKAVDLFLKVVG